ncbi:hypothetical protein FPV67DRAFT_1465203 [Lyophyllum atratum]|nr:hypothetical protein FPV67DRAFT_1465203 [Lyophyllum atratum]
MDSTLAIVPHISISLAPPEEPVIEPYSPFSATLTTPLDDDIFRPVHLTPPPTLTRFGKPLSPLRPCDDTMPAKGLERDRFEALLQASRERNVTFGTKRAGDLRKEIALKAHKNKQVERRALFLSKVLAPPSPTATLTPKTPPDSPAIFHYSLPSPGLVSPLALFESLSEDPNYGPLSYGREPWVEQVDFRLPEYTKAKEPRARMSGPNVGRPLPSLDQISARLSSQSHVQYRGQGGNRNTPAAPRQPAVLERPRLHIGVGRLQMPVRASKPTLEPLVIAPPKSPISPNLQVTTLVVPRSATTSPTKLSEFNLCALASRERRAHDMLSTLRRRTVVLERPVGEWKRHSAPADLLPLQQRSGFEHPVLALPGGF